ncbi:MAG: hypothetical protein GDA68_20955 [Nitrospira sp. CR2.1]|nr:hypothetical protein [Nitrospira sp. CR2.1]
MAEWGFVTIAQARMLTRTTARESVMTFRSKTREYRDEQFRQRGNAKERPVVWCARQDLNL